MPKLKDAAVRNGVFQSYIGGSMWESNPPRRRLTAHIGFEDREAHQLPIYFHVKWPKRRAMRNKSGALLHS